MERWKRAPNYMGETYYEYFVLLGQHRDSDSLTRSNFEVALERLGGESDSEPWEVVVVRSNHWAVGWVEFIGIHESASDKILIGEDIENELDCYPVLDDDHYSGLQLDEIYDYWEHASLRERLKVCHNAKASIFAARHDDLADDIFDYLRDTWDR